MSRFAIICSLYFLLTSVDTVAQNRTDTIEIVKDFGTKFYQNDYTLNVNELFWVTKYTPEMYDAKRTCRMGVLVSMIGGYFIGYPIRQHIGGNKDPIWEVALVGVGITAISLPIFSNANKKAIKGVKAFNHKVKHKKALS